MMKNLPCCQRRFAKERSPCWRPATRSVAARQSRVRVLAGLADRLRDSDLAASWFGVRSAVHSGADARAPPFSVAWVNTFIELENPYGWLGFKTVRSINAIFLLFLLRAAYSQSD